MGLIQEPCLPVPARARCRWARGRGALSRRRDPAALHRRAWPPAAAPDAPGGGAAAALAGALGVPLADLLLEGAAGLADPDRAALAARLLDGLSGPGLRSLLAAVHRAVDAAAPFDSRVALLAHAAGGGAAAEAAVVAGLEVELRGRRGGAADAACWIAGPRWGDEESAVPRAEAGEELARSGALPYDPTVKPLPLATARATVTKIYSDKMIADAKSDRCRPRRWEPGSVG